MKITLANSNGY